MAANGRTGTGARLTVTAIVTAVTALALAWSGAQALAAPRQASMGSQGSQAGQVSPAAAGVISTVAGGVGGPGHGTSVAVFRPCAVAFTAGQAVFTDSSGAVRELGMRTGWLTPLAGTGLPGFSGDGGPATRAQLSGLVCGVVVGPAGQVVLADSGNNRVRLIPARSGTYFGQAMTSGHIYTIAGTGTCCSAGSGEPASAAALNPAGVAFDRSGNLIIADGYGNLVWVLAASTGTFYGQAMTAGDVYIVAGGGADGLGDGGPATSASLNFPDAIAVDPAGNLVISDARDSRVRVIATRAGRFYGQSMQAGDIYTVAGSLRGGFGGDGKLATEAELLDPVGLAFDHAGNLLIDDVGNFRVRIVAARSGAFYGQPMRADHIYTVAGGGHLTDMGVPAKKARLNGAQGITVDSAGNLVLAMGGGFTQDGGDNVQVVAAGQGHFYGQPMRAGFVYTVAGNRQVVFSGDGGPATAAEMRAPPGVAADAAGDIFISSRRNARVRVVPARSGQLFGRAVLGGHIYTIAGGGTGPSTHGLATKAAIDPIGITIDRSGNLLVPGRGGVLVVAARPGRFYGQRMRAGYLYRIVNGQDATWVATDPAGDVLYAVTGFKVSQVQVLAARTGTWYGQAMTAGQNGTIAGDNHLGYGGDGGPATSTSLDEPGGISTDASGNLLIADTGNNRIRVVARTTGSYYGHAMTGGDIYTIAGDGTSGFAGDGGLATSAELSGPLDAIADRSGNILIADSGNERIRVLATATGTFYGQAMTAGHIYTIAGDGTSGFSGDGGPATSAELNGPHGLAVTTGGGVLIADTDSNRIRLMANR